MCLQEHWLFSFQESTLTEIDKTMCHSAKFVDEDNPLEPTNCPRGFGGVAILWDMDLDKHVEVITSANNRCVVISLSNQQVNYLIINTYMPSSGHSIYDYQSMLDEIAVLTLKYQATHRILWAGDLNGSLTRETPNVRDKNLRLCCKELNYVCHNRHPALSTFFAYNRKDNSQIDYILCQNPQATWIKEMSQLHRQTHNTSTHDPIIAIIEFNLQNLVQKQSSLTTSAKVNWKKIDIEAYKQLTAERIDVLSMSTLPSTVLIRRLEENLLEAALQLMPKPKPKRNSNVKWSPEIARCSKIAKTKFHTWKQAGRPKHHTSPEYSEMIESKRDLRRAQRKDSAIKRDNKIEQLMEAAYSNSPALFSLIKNPHNTKVVNEMVFDGEIVQKDHIPGKFADYFEDLASPLQDPDFDDEYCKNVELNMLLISYIEDQQQVPSLPSVTHQDVAELIIQLKNNKAPDEHGITSEHIKYASSSTIDILVTIINQVIQQRYIPDEFKTGLINPVHKKTKPIKSPNSYRRITITNLIGKILEKHVLKPLKTILGPSQNFLQRGFTENSSSRNTALLLTEALAEARDKKETLYLTYLDASKAFDIVWHNGLFVKLYDRGIKGNLWSLLANWYNGLSAKVKWQSQISRTLMEKQGVRQGGILSAEQYKAYINPLMERIQRYNLGYHIGSLDVSTPYCADDGTLVSNSIMNTQTMINFCHKDATRERYVFSQPKTKIQVHNTKITNSLWNSADLWCMNGDHIEVVEAHTHVGINRETCHQNNSHIIDERIQLARRSMYAMMGLGMHGLNGLNPTVTLHLWNVYCCPRMIYSLEALILTKQQINKLELFQRKVLKRIQHLPTSTATCSIYLLLGCLPIEGTLDKNYLSFFGNIIRHDSVEKNIIRRQLAVKDQSTHSWTRNIKEILNKYDLPSAYTLLHDPPSKHRWKKMITNAVNTYWLNTLQTEVQTKSSLRYLNCFNCSIGKPHIIYSSLGTSPQDVKRAAVKAQLITGTYRLASVSKHHSSKCPSSPLCPLCGAADETIQHFLQECIVIQSRCDQHTQDYFDDVASLLGEECLYRLQKEYLITQLIIDCTHPSLNIQHLSQIDLEQLEFLSRKLCFSYHIVRTQSLQDLRTQKRTIQH